MHRKNALGECHLWGGFLVAVLLATLVVPSLPDTSQAPQSTPSDDAPIVRRCTLIGCDSGVTLLSDLPLAFEALRQARISVCQNAECLTGDFAVLHEPPMEGRGSLITLPWDPEFIPIPIIGPRADITIWAAWSGALFLEVSWSTWQRSDARDGDVYRLTVYDEHGTEVLTLQETVDQYQDLYPNGKECESEPCRRVSIDRRQRTRP